MNIIFITHMYENNFLNQIKFTDNLSYSTTSAPWPDMTDYKVFNNSKLSKNGPNEYDEICDEELEYLVNSKVYLLENLMEIVIYNIYINY